MAASRARLEALLARVQQRATEPRTPSSAVAPVLEALKGGAAGSEAAAARAANPAESAEAPASVRLVAARAVAPAAAAQNAVAQSAVIPSAVIPSAVIPSAVAQRPEALSHGAVPQSDLDDDIEEYDDELIEIIDDAEVIPQAAAVARAIEPAAFGAAIDRRPAAPIRSEPARPASARPAPGPALEALRPEAVAPRPIAPTEVVRARNPRRELRHSAFVELLDASLDLG